MLLENFFCWVLCFSWLNVVCIGVRRVAIVYRVQPWNNWKRRSSSKETDGTSVRSVWMIMKTERSFASCLVIMVCSLLIRLISGSSHSPLAYHMKCIDPWLLNNRRQCPVCKRYVFPNQDNSDEEENHGPTVTERTPLIQATDENSPILRPMIRQSGKRVSWLRNINVT